MNKKICKSIGMNIAIGCISIICVFPIIVLLLRSFMSFNEWYINFHLFPRNWSIFGYEKILLMDYQYYVHFWNSVFYTVCILVGSLIISILAGYGFSNFEFPGKRILFVFYIVLMLLPFQATVVPQYLTIHSLGLLNHRAGVILPNLFATFGTILMTQYMQGIDKELLDAGKIDGLSGFRLFRKLVVPLCKPAISAYIVLEFIDLWNMIEQPKIFLSNIQLYPLSLRLGSISNEGILAGGVIFSILPLLIFRYFRNDMIEGISLSVIK